MTDTSEPGLQVPTATIDVLIPVYNGERYIEESVSSIQEQDLRSISIHIVDDGSTDKTGAIIRNLARRDDRIRIYSRENGGIVDALNFGLRHCSCDYIARHDADDIAAPWRFSRQIDILRRYPEVCATAGSARHIDAEGRSLGSRAELSPPELCNPYSFPAREPYLLHPFLMVRREALVGAGGYRFVLHAEDSDLYWRLRSFGRLYFDDQDYGAYRMHGESISSQSVRNGRVLAVSSQLAALSAVRREEGESDIIFSREFAGLINDNSASLGMVCEVAKRQLTPLESRHLRLSASTKLLEIAGYRPFELESSDCKFFDDAYRESSRFLSEQNHEALLKTVAGTSARLAADGRWRDAWRLCKFRNPIGFLLRVAFRLLLPEALILSIKKAIRAR